MSSVIDHLNQLAVRHASEDDVLEQIGLWVPSERILVFRLELPKVSRRKQQEMLPWMLEDQLLSPPDSFEFLIADHGSTESLIYVVEKAVLGQWMLLAESASVAPNRMVPDFLALPYEEGRWTVYSDKGRLLVRTGIYEGFAASLGFGWQQLELMLSQLEEPVRLSHLTTADTDIPESLAEHIDTETGKINWAFTEFPLAIDILPTLYRPKRTNSFKQWVPAMAAGLFLAVISMSYMLAQTWAWQRDAVVLNEAVGQAYQSLFSQKLTGSTATLIDSAETQLALLEHQYIANQTSPLSELSALDRVFSTCSDCVLINLNQSDSGLTLKLKENARVKTRLEGIEGLSINWGLADSDNITTVNIQRGDQ